MVSIVKIKPVIKWSGSKRSQSQEIVSRFPKEISTYYEPFVGGGSVLYQLIYSDVQVKEYVCSDFNPDLITLWKEIKKNPEELSKTYEELWTELNNIEDDDDRKEYFYTVRDRFNKHKDPHDFLFLSRTCTNGLIRYNLKGEFNTSLHFSRKGINPKTLNDIILDWSNRLNENNVKFIHRSYEDITTKQDDFLYLDPPYANTKGMYFGAIDYELLWDWMRVQQAEYMLSFNGVSGVEDSTYDVPKDLYSQHIYLDSGSSSFRRTVALKNEMVRESLYIK